MMVAKFVYEDGNKSESEAQAPPKQGVRVNAVAPGLTLTPLVFTCIEDHDDPDAFQNEVVASIPQGRMAAPSEIANAILFLASDESRHVTGISLAVHRGYAAA